MEDEPTIPFLDADCILVFDGNGIKQFRIENILYLYLCNGELKIVSLGSVDKNKLWTVKPLHYSLSHFARLAEQGFWKINRKAMVNVVYLEGISNEQILKFFYDVPDRLVVSSSEYQQYLKVASNFKKPKNKRPGNAQDDVLGVEGPS